MKRTRSSRPRRLVRVRRRPSSGPSPMIVRVLPGSCAADIPRSRRSTPCHWPIDPAVTNAIEVRLAHSGASGRSATRTPLVSVSRRRGAMRRQGSPSRSYCTTRSAHGQADGIQAPSMPRRPARSGQGRDEPAISRMPAAVGVGTSMTSRVPCWWRRRRRLGMSGGRLQWDRARTTWGAVSPGAVLPGAVPAGAELGAEPAVVCSVCSARCRVWTARRSGGTRVRLTAQPRSVNVSASPRILASGPEPGWTAPRSTTRMVTVSR